MNFRVSCPQRNIEDQHMELDIGADDTVDELKQMVCSHLGVHPGAMQMFTLFRTWGASTRLHKFSLLDDVKLDHYLWQANVRNGQHLLLQSKVMKIIVWCSTPQWGMKEFCVPAMDSVQQLKAEAACRFGLPVGCCELWGYCMGRKQLSLEDRLLQTLTAANIWDGRNFLLEHKVPQRMQQQRQQTQEPQQQSQPSEQQQIVHSQQQLPQCDPREEQLVHALLEYLRSPAAPTNDSCFQTQEQLAELLSRALVLQQQACNKDSSSTSADHKIAAVEQGRQVSEPCNNTAVGNAKAADELQQLRSCVVCLDRPRSVMLLPCKHLALCDDCSEQLRNQARNNNSSSLGQLQTPCPVCRASAYHHMPGVILS